MSNDRKDPTELIEANESDDDVIDLATDIIEAYAAAVEHADWEHSVHGRSAKPASYAAAAAYATHTNLTRRVKRGRLARGPTQPEVCDEYGTSPHSLRKALGNFESTLEPTAIDSELKRFRYE